MMVFFSNSYNFVGAIVCNQPVCRSTLFADGDELTITDVTEDKTYVTYTKEKGLVTDPDARLTGTGLDDDPFLFECGWCPPIPVG